MHLTVYSNAIWFERFSKCDWLELYPIKLIRSVSVSEAYRIVYYEKLFNTKSFSSLGEDLKI